MTKNSIWMKSMNKIDIGIKSNTHEFQKIGHHQFSSSFFAFYLPVSFGNLRRTWESPKNSCSLLISSSWKQMKINATWDCLLHEKYFSRKFFLHFLTLRALGKLVIENIFSIKKKIKLFLRKIFPLLKKKSFLDFENLINITKTFYI